MEWYGRALAGKEKALGKDHPDKLTTVHNMSLVFQCEVLERYGRALASRESIAGQ